MKTITPKLDHIQSFYAVARHGSLSAAAQAEGGSLPTLSRHIAALEAAYGITLFERRSDGFNLTQSGTRLFEYAREVRTAGARFATAAAGSDEAIAGTVRISASRNVATLVLPEILAHLGQQQPDIRIELVATDTASNLLLREADIAIRMFRPHQSTLIARKIGAIRLGAYASCDYLERKGTPHRLDDLARHDLIGDDSDESVNAELRAMGLNITPDFFRYRCEDPTVAWNLVRAGCGIGLGHIRIASDDPTVVRVLDAAPALSLPVWLVSHAELRTSARVRVVFDHLAEHLATALEPPS